MSDGRCIGLSLSFRGTRTCICVHVNAIALNTLHMVKDPAMLFWMGGWVLILGGGGDQRQDRRYHISIICICFCYK